MEKNIDELVKPVEKNGKVLTLQDTSEEGPTWYNCSTFIEKKKVLVRGECKKDDTYNRNAMIVLFDAESGEVLGWPRLNKLK